MQTFMEQNRAVFIITDERNCPAYSVKDEFRVQGLFVSVSHGKALCVKVAAEIANIFSFGRDDDKRGGSRNADGMYRCGGCVGEISFFPKRVEKYSTVQMKLLAETSHRNYLAQHNECFALMRPMEPFAELDDDQLRDLCAHATPQKYEPDEIISRKGSIIARLYIVLDGQVIRDEGIQTQASILFPGDIFGEMGLVAETLHRASYRSIEPVFLATWEMHWFKSFLSKHPTLQVVFYRALIKMGQNRMKGREHMQASMQGLLSDIGVVDLFQLIHSTQKSGRLHLDFVDGKGADAIFKDGELVKAQHGKFRDKQAFFFLLGVTKGSFSFSTGLEPAEENLPVIGDFMGLIMEGMQRLDEQIARQPLFFDLLN